MHLRARWSLVAASIPLWPIFGLLILASAVRASFGFWPSFNHPDPSNEGSWILLLDFLIAPLLLGAPLAVLGSAGFVVHAWHERRWDWWFPLTVGCFVVLVAWCRVDPGGLFAWWID